MGCSGFKPNPQLPPPIVAPDLYGSQVYRTAKFGSVSGPISGTYVATQQNPSGVIPRPGSIVMPQPMYQSFPSKIPGGGMMGTYSSRTGDVMAKSGSLLHGTVTHSGVAPGATQLPTINIMPPTEQAAATVMRQTLPR